MSDPSGGDEDSAAEVNRGSGTRERDLHRISEAIGASSDEGELRQLIARREHLRGRSIEEIGEEFGWERDRVEQWVAVDQDDDSTAHRGTRDYLSRFRALGGTLDIRSIVHHLAIIGLIFIVLLMVFQPGLVLGVREEVLTQYWDLRGDSVRAAGSESLSIAVEEVEYLNRIFREQDTEVGYCGLIDDSNSLTPWLAELENTTESSVLVSANNCPTWRANRLALLHTHPNGDPRPSPDDRASLEDDRIAYMCIQHGQITATIGTPTSRLRCYKGGQQDASESIERVPVYVTRG